MTFSHPEILHAPHRGMVHASFAFLAATVFTICSPGSPGIGELASEGGSGGSGGVATSVPGEPDRGGLPFGLGEPHVRGQLIVRFAGAGTIALEQNEDAQALLRQLRATPVLGPKPRSGARLVGFPLVQGRSEVSQELEVALQIDRSGLAESIWANNLVFPHTIVPNDELFDSQWALDAPGTDEDIDAPEAWATSVGCADVRVAVVDSGIGTNPDLVNRIWVNPCEDKNGNRSADDDDGVDDVCGDEVADGNVYADDYRGWNFVNGNAVTFDAFGHGSEVAGVIGAEADNGLLILGVNHRVTLIPVKVMGSGPGTVWDAANGIEYAVRLRVDVINTSWGTIDVPSLKDAVAGAEAAGILIVGSAGNELNDLAVVSKRGYPSSYPNENVISVAATSPSGDLWVDALDVSKGSNFGVEVVDLGAPGESIRSTQADSDTSLRSGTSLSAAFVSGVAALIKCHDPDVTMAEMRSRLLDGDPLESLAGKTVSGRRLNASRALASSGDGDDGPGVPSAPFLPE